MSRRWWALGVLCLSLLAIVIDNTIVNVALPTLVRELDAGVSELQWVVDAYTLVFAGLLLLAGSLGDRYGRRRTLLAGLAVFAVGSAAAAYAGGVEALIAARAVMGAGAAFIMPATLSLLISVFEDPRERATAIGVWAATAGLGVALGPVVGGLLLDRFWWGSIFIVNLPLCALALVAGPRLLPESRDPAAPRVDWAGAALSGAGLIALVWARHRGAGAGLDVGAGAAARRARAAALTAFVVQQRRAAEPLLDLRLFRDPRFTAASATIMVLFFALFGFLFLSTQYLQFVLGLSPSAAGVRVLPYAGAMIVFASCRRSWSSGSAPSAWRPPGWCCSPPGLASPRRSRGERRLRAARGRVRADGRGDGARRRAGDRVDHGRAPARAGEHRLGRQRHHARARRRARRRHRRQHHVVAVRAAAAGRRAGLARPAVQAGVGDAARERSPTRCRAPRSSSPWWRRWAP